MAMISAISGCAASEATARAMLASSLRAGTMAETVALVFIGTSERRIGSRRIRRTGYHTSRSAFFAEETLERAGAGCRRRRGSDLRFAQLPPGRAQRRG